MKNLRNALLGCTASLAFASLSFAQIAPYIPPGPQVMQGIPGKTVVMGAAPAAFTFTGVITVTTVGSYTTGVLSVTQPTTANPVQIPIGSVITGSGVTAGTVVTGQFSGTSNYNVITTGGTIAAVASETLTATPKLATLIQDTTFTTAPTYASGGCTAGSPAFSATSTVSSWSYTNGTGTCTGGNTVTFTFPAATASWMCTAVSTLNPTTDIYISTGSVSTTAVVFTDYSAAGAAQNTKANDVITGSCTPR